MGKHTLRLAVAVALAACVRCTPVAEDAGTHQSEAAQRALTTQVAGRGEAAPLSAASEVSDAELRKAGPLALPLVPVGETTPADNAALLLALREYEQAAA